MHVQIVEFELAGLSRHDYEALTEQLGPAFAELPGLIAKVWILDPASNRAGGVYTWTDREACERYLDGELFAAAKANPALANLRTRDYEVLAVTDGLPVAA